MWTYERQAYPAPPTTVEPVRLPDPRRLLGVVLLLLLVAVAACGDAGTPPAPPPSSSTASAATPAAPTPADGVSLQSLGYLNGPARQFSLPRSSVLTAAVDQTNNVTAVLSSPPATEVAAYLRRTLPEAGFQVVADDPAALTMTFTGFGWSGSFTGTEKASAVLLRPQ
jgi:hypothetical protein